MVAGALALGLAAAVVGPATAQERKWVPHFHLEGKLGNERSLGEANLFVPFGQGPESLWFGDLRAQMDRDRNAEVNIGLGHRVIVDQRFILGLYGFLDLRRTENRNLFFQGTGGAEILTEDFDFRVNAYLPLGSSRRTVSDTTEMQQSGALEVVQGGALQMRTSSTPMRTRTQEIALHGFDAEVGWRLPLFPVEARHQVRVYGGGFWFDGSGARTVAGPRGSLQYELHGLTAAGDTSRLTLGVEAQHDEVRRGQIFGFTRLTLALGRPMAQVYADLGHQRASAGLRLRADEVQLAQGRTHYQDAVGGYRAPAEPRHAPSWYGGAPASDPRASPAPVRESPYYFDYRTGRYVRRAPVAPEPVVRDDPRAPAMVERPLRRTAWAALTPLERRMVDRVRRDVDIVIHPDTTTSTGPSTVRMEDIAVADTGQLLAGKPLRVVRAGESLAAAADGPDRLVLFQGTHVTAATLDFEDGTVVSGPGTMVRGVDSGVAVRLGQVAGMSGEARIDGSVAGAPVVAIGGAGGFYGARIDNAATAPGSDGLVIEGAAGGLVGVARSDIRTRGGAGVRVDGALSGEVVAIGNRITAEGPAAVGLGVRGESFTIVGNEIVTKGTGAHGIETRGGGGLVLSNRVTTEGTGATGIRVADIPYSASGIDVVVADNRVRTIGNESPGIDVIGAATVLPPASEGDERTDAQRTVYGGRAVIGELTPAVAQLYYDRNLQTGDRAAFLEVLGEIGLEPSRNRGNEVRTSGQLSPGIRTRGDFNSVVANRVTVEGFRSIGVHMIGGAPFTTGPRPGDPAEPITTIGAWGTVASNQITLAGTGPGATDASAILIDRGSRINVFGNTIDARPEGVRGIHLINETRSTLINNNVFEAIGSGGTIIEIDATSGDVRGFESVPPAILPLPPALPVPDPGHPDFDALMQAHLDREAERAEIEVQNERALEARLAGRFGGGWANTGGGNINATGSDQVCRDRTVESLNDIVILSTPGPTGAVPSIGHRDSLRLVCRGGP